MTADNKERIRRKIAKLMEFANDQRANKHEAERALSQAEKMMQMHGFEEADLLFADIKADDMQTAQEQADIGKMKSCPPWIGILSFGVAIFTDTIASWTSHLGGYRGIRFSGEVADVAVACWLMKYLMEAVTRERKRDGIDSGAREGHSYRRAAAAALQDRMKNLRAQRDEVFKTATTGTALMVVDAKKAKVEEVFGAQQPENKRVSTPNALAAMLGYAAGNRINLHKQLSGETQNKLLN